MQNNLQVDSAAITDKGLSEKRPQNEDSYLELRDSGFYAVADGVGGAQAGDVASQMAMEILGEGFINLQEGGDAEERMKLAIEQANSSIFQMSRDLPQLSTMATTVVGLHINGNIATIGHVGDSRLYRVDSQGELFRETQDHSVVEEEVRAGRLTPEQALTHPSRNVISRALGAENVVEIDMKTILFEPGTSFLICSDGVTRHIADEELRGLLSSEKDTFEICQVIKDVCYERGAEDNLTAVVIRVTEKPSSEFEVLDEEETVASARPQLADSSVFETVASENLTEDTLEMPQPDAYEVNLESSDFEKGSPISIAANSGEEDPSLAGEDSVALNSDTAEAYKPEEVTTFRVDEDAAGPAGKLLLVLPWLLLLGLLALAAYYFWPANQATSGGVNDLQSQSTDVDMTAFEKTRRHVDKDPGAYIAKHSNNPTDAADYYFIGRGYFLQKKYDLAKVQLQKASELLNEPGAVANKKILETEIPLMLSVVNSAEARSNFENSQKQNPANVDSPAP